MAKRRSSGFAFDPPSNPGMWHGTPLGQLGLGHYYAALRMNKWEVNKRIKERKMDDTEAGQRVTDSYMKNRGRG